jgi:hypothetical protein
MSNPYVITDEMVCDIIVCAFEGGSYYWAPKAEIVKEPAPPEGGWENFVKYGQEHFWANGGEYRVFEPDDEGGEEGTWHTLTTEVMRKGIRKAAEHMGLTPERFYDEHDADSADVALQYALLGEVVYG